MDEQVKAALYLRVSTEEQAAEGTTSIPEQERRCRELCEQRGWQVVAVYSDEGFTGTKAERPDWDRLMADAGRGGFTRVVCLNWKRYARSTRVGLNIGHDLKQRGVSVTTVEGETDTRTKEGRFTRTVLLGAAEYDRDALIEQMANGQRAKHRKGGWPGGKAGYGWKVVRDLSLPPEQQARSARLMLEESETWWLRKAVDIIVDEGGSYYGAAQRLAELGVRGRNGKVIHPDTLRDALRNRAMFGEFTWGGGRHATGEYGEPVVWQAEQQVISRERWDQLQAALGTRKRPDQHTGRTYPLAGGAFVSACGQAYGGWFRSDRDSGRMYRCRGRRWQPDGTPKCACHHLDAQGVEVRVWHQVRALFAEPGRLVALASAWLELEAPATPAAGELASVRRQAARLERRLTEDAARWLRAGVSAEVVKAGSSALEAELSTLRAREAAIVSARQDAQQRAAVRQAVGELAERAARRLAGANLEYQREVLGLLAVRVSVTENAKAPALRIEGSVPVGSSALVHAPGRPLTLPWDWNQGRQGDAPRVPFSLAA